MSESLVEPNTHKESTFMRRLANFPILAPLGLVALLSCGKPEAEPAKEVKPFEVGSSETPAAPPAPRPSEPGSSADVIPPPPPGVTDGKPAESAATKASTLVAVDWKGYEEVLATHKGKAIAIDAWASWCVPCREKFPKFIELSKELADKEIVFLGMNFDEPEEEAAANEFLQETGATFPNYRMKDELFAVQDRLDFAGVPRYFLYDADGKIILNSNSIDELAAKVKELFAKP